MGLGLRQKIQKLNALKHFVCFRWKCMLSGFENSLVYLQRLDKVSLLFLLKKYGANIGQHVDIETGLTLHNCSDFSNLTVGDDSHIGKNCFIDLKDKVSIGKRVTISMQCALISHQDMGKSVLDKTYGKSHAPIQIGDDAYLGINSTILQGVVVGEAAIVAAGSLAKQSIKPHTIYGGIPAKELKAIPK